MINFVILTNKKYFLKFKLCYDSMIKYSKDFHIYVFCEDIDYQWIKDQKLSNITINKFSVVEKKSPAILKEKNLKTPTEYAWTVKPNAVDYVLNNYDVDHAILIGADTFFFNDPNLLLDCLPDKYSVGLSPHKFSSHYNYTFIAGIYNTDYVHFKNNEIGKACARWWGDRCIDYCYKFEKHNKFCGDQTYANYFGQVLPKGSVWEIWDGGVNAADYNIDQYTVYKSGFTHFIQKIDEVTDDKLIFYQFHAFKSYLNDTGEVVINQGAYDTIPESAIRLVYKPYLDKLKELKEIYTNLEY